MNRRIIRLKEKELASLDEKAHRKRKRLEREICILHEALRIEEETLRNLKAHERLQRQNKW